MPSTSSASVADTFRNYSTTGFQKAVPVSRLMKDTTKLVGKTTGVVLKADLLPSEVMGPLKQVKSGASDASIMMKAIELPGKVVDSAHAVTSFCKDPSWSKVRTLFFNHACDRVKRGCDVLGNVSTKVDALKPAGPWFSGIAGGAGMLMAGNAIVDTGFEVSEYCNMSEEKRAEVPQGFCDKTWYYLVSFARYISQFALGVFSVIGALFSVVFPPLGLAIVSLFSFTTETTQFVWDKSAQKNEIEKYDVDQMPLDCGDEFLMRA